MTEARVSQHAVQALHTGGASNAKVSQHAVQVLVGAPTGILFHDLDCTSLYSKETNIEPTINGLSWSVLNSNDGSAVTSILDKGNNLNLYEGEGFINTDITPGNYIVIVQDGTGQIGAYVMDAN